MVDDIFLAVLQPLNGTFIGVSLIIFFFAWKGKIDKSLLTGIGILGTFLGVFLGLMNFNVQDIEHSVPTLLDGLKTAFLTSIVGLILSVIISIKEAYLNRHGTNENEKDELELLREIRNEGRGQNEFFLNIIEELKKLNKNISGDGDTTLMTQIQKLRTTISDKLDELNESFEDFARKMTENNMKALIEAIQQVMEDFNTKINNQLGQSFKELTEGINSMLVWQKEYKEQIKISTYALEKAKEGIEASELAVAKIISHAESFDKLSSNIENGISSLQNSTTQLNTGLTELSKSSIHTKEMAETLISSMKELQVNFVSKASDLVEKNNQQIEFMIKEFKEQGEKMKVSYQNSLQNMEDSIDRQMKGIEQAQQKSFDSMGKGVENLGKQMNEQFIRSATSLESQVTELDKKLGEELSKSLTTLGQQLTALSNGFVEGYTRYAKELESIVTSIRK